MAGFIINVIIRIRSALKELRIMYNGRIRH